MIEVVDWSPRWVEQFEEVADVLRTALADVTSARVEHVGSTSVPGREAFHAPDEPRRNVYVCTAGTANVRNHLAVRDVLRRRADLREAYAAVKKALAADPDIDIDAYIARKSAVLQEVLEAAGEVSDEELAAIRQLNGTG